MTTPFQQVTVKKHPTEYKLGFQLTDPNNVIYWQFDDDLLPFDYSWRATHQPNTNDDTLPEFISQNFGSTNSNEVQIKETENEIYCWSEQNNRITNAVSFSKQKYSLIVTSIYEESSIVELFDAVITYKGNTDFGSNNIRIQKNTELGNLIFDVCEKMKSMGYTILAYHIFHPGQTSVQITSTNQLLRYLKPYNYRLGTWQLVFLKNNEKSSEQLLMFNNVRRNEFYNSPIAI